MDTPISFLGRIDRLFAALIAGGLAIDIALWLYVGWRLPNLPSVLAIHYNSAGQVDRIGVREQLYVLPGIGLVILLANGLGGYFGVYRRDQQLTYLLLGVGILAQILLAGAVIQLIH
jgi:Domain of unknown function (DUF1648)